MENVDIVMNYTFGGLSLLLIGLLVKGIKMWRDDAKESSENLIECCISSTKALSSNASATEKLSSSLDNLGELHQKLNDRLLSRPCMIEDRKEG